MIRFNTISDDVLRDTQSMVVNSFFIRPSFLGVVFRMVVPEKIPMTLFTGERAEKTSLERKENSNPRTLYTPEKTNMAFENPHFQ